MIGVVRIDPDVVIVDVFVSLAETTQRAAAVVRDHQKHVHDVDAIDVFWIGNDARVVHRRRIKLVAPFPTAAAIARAKDSAAAIGGFDSRIDHV